ncbi:hypothetical protein CLV41_12111 [Roseibium marinum]|uniref:Uncharacterized protein n=1 Tax=Roseibium marinum TaxID=281252 RepID=A0A2S3UJE8_9HYPH|nr:hypothetical protein CLV41_12111 [Roseibium marinum]
MNIVIASHLRKQCVLLILGKIQIIMSNQNYTEKARDNTQVLREARDLNASRITQVDF